MATDVVMPQMGESIAEGTIVRWIKKVGDRVERDEPLFEISTDKVDAEIPAPAAGVVSEIRHQEGETVAVNTVVAVIGDAGAAKSAPPAPKAESVHSPAASPAGASVAPVQTDRSAPDEGPSRGQAPSAGGSARQGREPDQDGIHQRSSPLVRRIAKEHGIDISRIDGTGIAGRVTKDDILAFIAAKPGGRSPSAPPAPRASATRSEPPPQPGHVEKMSVMRKKIAEHMILSRRTSAHVHSVYEVNFARVSHVRDAKKAEYDAAGVKLTYLSFIMKVVVDALRAMPIVNSSIDGENIVYHEDVNVGVAVALEWGLIVPVVKKADEKNLLGLSRAIADLASRARTKQLKPDEVSGGTFTITNPGVFGALFGMPIINQPQVAILGVGHIEKRPIVIDDAIAIRPMAYLTLGYDHRLIDGAVADQFMSQLKHSLENWDEVDG